ncbi:MAG: helix-turn-helix transcriptional regulator [Candidatus Firestonebacteria bacterium]|nr:helix-turn-helix transcriptional regulator [Candidatus Firestonebacteria bacterium]
MAGIEEKIGKNIYNIRKAKGLTQNDVAEVAELSNDYISLIERAKRHPSIHILNRISKGLGVQLSDLINVGEHEFNDMEDEKVKSIGRVTAYLKDMEMDEIEAVHEITQRIYNIKHGNRKKRTKK